MGCGHRSQVDSHISVSSTATQQWPGLLPGSASSTSAACLSSAAQLTDVIFYDAGLFSKAYLFVPIRPHRKVSFAHFVVQVLPPPPISPGGRGVTEVPPAQIDLGPLDIGQKSDFADVERSDLLALYNFFIDTDVNMDGYVNVLDLILVRNDLGQTPASARNPRCDCNHDVKINVLDLIIVRNDLGWPF